MPLDEYLDRRDFDATPEPDGQAAPSVGDDGPIFVVQQHDDEEADARRDPVSTEPASVLSGRTLDEVVEEPA